MGGVKKKKKGSLCGARCEDSTGRTGRGLDKTLRCPWGRNWGRFGGYVLETQKRRGQKKKKKNFSRPQKKIPPRMGGRDSKTKTGSSSGLYGWGGRKEKGLGFRKNPRAGVGGGGGKGVSLRHLGPTAWWLVGIVRARDGIEHRGPKPPREGKSIEEGCKKKKEEGNWLTAAKTECGHGGVNVESWVQKKSRGGSAAEKGGKVRKKKRAQPK